MYEIVVNNEIKKNYPTREQCIAWCYRKGKMLLSRKKKYMACSVVIRKKMENNVK
jgi:hypothetical protein